MFDFTSWPQAGRDQFQRILLKAMEKNLRKALEDKVPSSKSVKQLQHELEAVRQALSELST